MKVFDSFALMFDEMPQWIIFGGNRLIWILQRFKSIWIDHQAVDEIKGHDVVPGLLVVKEQSILKNDIWREITNFNTQNFVSNMNVFFFFVL